MLTQRSNKYWRYVNSLQTMLYAKQNRMKHIILHLNELSSEILSRAGTDAFAYSNKIPTNHDFVNLKFVKAVHYRKPIPRAHRRTSAYVYRRYAQPTQATRATGYGYGLSKRPCASAAGAPRTPARHATYAHSHNAILQMG